MMRTTLRPVSNSTCGSPASLSRSACGARSGSLADEHHLSVEPGQLQGRLGGRLAGPEDDHRPAAEEGGVAVGAVADAAPQELLLTRDGEARRRAAAGDDHGAPHEGESLARVDLEGIGGRHHRVDVLPFEGVYGKAADVVAEVLRQLGSGDEPGAEVVLDVSGPLWRAAELTGDHRRGEALARRVDGRRESGRAATDDHHIVAVPGLCLGHPVTSTESFRSLPACRGSMPGNGAPVTCSVRRPVRDSRAGGAEPAPPACDAAAAECARGRRGCRGSCGRGYAWAGDCLPVSDSRRMRMTAVLATWASSNSQSLRPEYLRMIIVSPWILRAASSTISAVPKPMTDR